MSTSSLVPAATLIGERVRAAYYGILIADALSMPVHWFYNRADIKRAFPGGVRGYEAAPKVHPSSIMPLSSTGASGGRGAQTGDIIGRVINHGRKHLWGVPNQHYHTGMKAGENTLNAILARVTARAVLGLPPLAGPAGSPPAGPTPAAALAAGAPYNAAHFLAAYVPFMTTPGTHNDTYAETHIRQFYGNFAKGRPPAECADNDGHNTWVYSPKAAKNTTARPTE